MLRKKEIIKFYKLCYPIQCHSLSLTTTLKLILINNGSLTQNFNSITNNKIKIHLIKQKQTNSREIIREVWLQNITQKIAFAISYWKKNNANITKIIKNQPIGQSIILNETDIYKEIQYIKYGYNYNLEKIMQIKRPIWNRKYTIWLDKKSLATIEEFFSIYLNKSYYHHN